MLTPPPLFVSYPSQETYLAACASQLSQTELDANRELIRRELPPVTSVQQLAILFGYSARFVGTMLHNPRAHYRRFTIPKGRQLRQISAPRIGIKVIQAWFGHHLARSFAYPEHVHGFVPGKSTVSAARLHCPAQWVWTIDLENFFGSVTARHIHDVLKTFGYPGAGAWLVASLTTLENRLPQGSPASPALSNLCFFETDRALAGIATTLGVRISRYVDDIAFSGSDAMPGELETQVEAAINENSWQIAVDKTQLMTAPGRLSILGILIDDTRPRLSRRYRHRLRMMQHILNTVGPDARKANRFAGHLSYARSVH